MARKIIGATVGTTIKPQSLIDKTNYEEKINNICEESLRQAKESGEFDGKDGKDGKDGTSISHRWDGTILNVTSASGTTSADLKGEKGDPGEGGSGGGVAIIDVLELPTNNISENSLYRLLNARLIQNQYIQVTFTCHCVEKLPSSGLPATNLDQTQGNVYYCLSDNQAYGYVDSTLSAGMGVPSGWYPVATLLGALGYGYGGIITDFADDLNDDKFRLYLEYDLYSYKDEWIMLDNIAKVGTGVYSNISNHPLNIASGNYSSAEGIITKATGYCSHAEGNNTQAKGNNAHAEGFETVAEGLNSHAEGDNTHAEGQMSHAEGSDTHAKGVCSHAEGDNTTAEGYYSHAEGSYTVASGQGSHAEGVYTKASSNYQHVQGKCNIEDTNYIYAHIVGNGTSTDNLSNAHTLDWNGNAWYAGVVRVGGTSYDDAKELATKEWVNELLGGIENGTY